MQITLGALEPPLSKQLAGRLPAEVLASLDKFNDSITLLFLHGLLTDPETNRARKRLIKKIQVAALIGRTLQIANSQPQPTNQTRPI